MCIMTRILQVYIEDFTGFSHVLESSSLSRLCPWNSFLYGNGEPRVHSTDGEGVGSLPLPGSSFQVKWRSHPLSDLLQKVFTGYSLNHQNTAISLKYPLIGNEEIMV